MGVVEFVVHKAAVVGGILHISGCGRLVLKREESVEGTTVVETTMLVEKTEVSTTGEQSFSWILKER